MKLKKCWQQFFFCLHLPFVVFPRNGKKRAFWGQNVILFEKIQHLTKILTATLCEE